MMVDVPRVSSTLVAVTLLIRNAVVMRNTARTCRLVNDNMSL